MRIYASDYVKLDSNVITGGGTDQTEALQALLDKAPECGRLHLILDGAALVRGLKLHDNTTIECPDKSCGLFLADHSDTAVLMTARRSYRPDTRTRNITLIGGTYNHNCRNQAHHVPSDDPDAVFLNLPERYREDENNHFTVALEFIGVEYLTVRGVTIRDQRTFAFTAGNFAHITVEDTWVDLVNEIPKGNQDGFHFWGPGQFLTLRNVGGRTEDDFMNIGPDERDGVSSITDVLIDGVFLDHAWQGIRLLSRGEGRLDRVTVRNVTGTCRSFGFYINPWFVSENNGHFGHITFENIDLRSEQSLMDSAYPNPPFLFSIGGDIEALTLRHIVWHHPYDTRYLFQIGYPYHDVFAPLVKTPRIGLLLIDGLQVDEVGTENADTVYSVVRGRVDHFVWRDIDVRRAETEQGCGCLCRVLADGSVGRLCLDRVYAENLGTLLDCTEGETALLQLHNVTVQAVDTVVAGTPARQLGEVTVL